MNVEQILAILVFAIMLLRSCGGKSHRCVYAFIGAEGVREAVPLPLSLK